MALYAALLSIPIAHLVIIFPVQWSRTDTARDAWHYYLAGVRIQSGEPLYSPLPPPGPIVPGGEAYVYPPLHAAALSRLPLSWPGFARVSLVVNWLAMWAYAACLGKLSRGRYDVYGTLVWGAAITATAGGIGAVQTGQVDPVLWLLFGLALVSARLRGFCLALSALVKPTAIWPLLVGLYRDKRVVAGSAVAAAFAALLTGIAFGDTWLDTWWTWLTAVYPSLAQGQFAHQPLLRFDDARVLTGFVAWFWTGNQSLAMLPLYAILGMGWSGPIPMWARAWLTIVGFAAPLIAARMTRRYTEVFQMAVTMAAAVVFAPIFRMKYVPLLFAAVAVGLRPVLQVRPPAGRNPSQ